MGKMGTVNHVRLWLSRMDFIMICHHESYHWNLKIDIKDWNQEKHPIAVGFHCVIITWAYSFSLTKPPVQALSLSFHEINQLCRT